MRKTQKDGRELWKMFAPFIGLAGLGLAFVAAGPAISDVAAKSGKTNKTVPTSATGKMGALSGMTFSDLAGNRYGVAQIAGHKASVFLFVSSQCPISNVYAPRFTALAEEYGKRGIQVFAVYSNTQEGLAEIKAHARQHKLTFPVVRDAGSQLADKLGATVTPQAVVVDASGTVCYRGRIDDNAVATKVTRRELTDALQAVLNSQPVATPKTLAFGCAIRRAKPAVLAAPGVPTYAREVAAILQAKCIGCHRPGEVAPFALTSYAQARAWAGDIKRYTQSGQMPPWKPAPDYGEIKDAEAHQLQEKERVVLAKWADAGAPLGNPKQVPPARTYSQEWQMGTPDLVVTPSREFRLKADGDDVYRNFVVKTNFPEDRYVRAIEIRPGNRAVVHHVINYIDGMGASDKLEGKENDGQPGYITFGGPGFNPTGMLGGWAPGNNPTVLPDGVGIKLPKNGRVVIQVHYHKDGKPETDRTKVGLYFADKPIHKSMVDRFVVNTIFAILPGRSDYPANAIYTLPYDAHIFSVLPHMHWLGKSIKVWAELPDKTEKPLVWIKDWDFNWQGTYYLKEPLAAPKGTRIHVASVFDNSANNLRNPNRAHLKTTTWGEQTTDEMCLAYVGLTRDGEQLDVAPVPAPSRTAQASGNTAPSVAANRTR